MMKKKPQNRLKKSKKLNSKKKVQTLTVVNLKNKRFSRKSKFNQKKSRYK